MSDRTTVSSEGTDLTEFVMQGATWAEHTPDKQDIPGVLCRFVRWEDWAECGVPVPEDLAKTYIIGHPKHDGGLLEILLGHGVFRPMPLDGDEHTACSFGKGNDGKWYGWSHRAIIGFGIGDMLFTEDALAVEGAEDVPYAQVGKVKIETDAQARQAAKNFAAYIS